MSTKPYIYLGHKINRSGASYTYDDCGDKVSFKRLSEAQSYIDNKIENDRDQARAEINANTQ